MSSNVYQTHPAEFLSQSALESIASLEHPFDEAACARILTQVESAPEVSRARRTAVQKRVLVALIAAAFVVLAGFTVYDRVLTAWDEWAGVEGVSDYAENVGKIAADQGIRVEIESALSDGVNTYFLVSFVDEEGGRVSDNMGFGHWISYVDGVSYAGSAECLGFDEDSGVAHYVFQIDGDMTGSEVFVELYTLFLDEWSCYAFQDEVDLAGLAREGGEGNFVDFAWDLTGYSDPGTGVFTRESYLSSPSNEMDEREATLGQVLEPDVMHVELANAADAYLSNVAYRDGRLYVQASTTMAAHGDRQVSLGLYDRSTHEWAGAESGSIYYRYKELGDGAHQDIYEVWFEVPYEGLGNYVLLATGHGWGDVLEGEWSFGFGAPVLEAPALEAEMSVRVEGGTLTSVKVTPFSITYEGDADDPEVDYWVGDDFYSPGGYIETPDMVLVHADGTRTDVEWSSGTGRGDPDGVHQVHTFLASVGDIESVVAIELNGVRVDLR